MLKVKGYMHNNIENNRVLHEIDVCDARNVDELYITVIKIFIFMSLNYSSWFISHSVLKYKNEK
jgi:hypothetical protein